MNNDPYRSPPPVYHTIHLSEAEVKEAIRMFAATHSREVFPTGQTQILLSTAEGGVSGVIAEVIGPNKDPLPHADEQR